MRGELQLFSPHPNPLPVGEGEGEKNKHYLAVGSVSFNPGAVPGATGFVARVRRSLRSWVHRTTHRSDAQAKTGPK
jgi:hypothetical protein